LTTSRSQPIANLPWEIQKKAFSTIASHGQLLGLHD